MNKKQIEEVVAPYRKEMRGLEQKNIELQKKNAQLLVKVDSLECEVAGLKRELDSICSILNSEEVTPEGIVKYAKMKDSFDLMAGMLRKASGVF